MTIYSLVLKDIASKLSVPVFNFDLLSDRELFVPARDALEKIALEHKAILIDEVQDYPESTVALKILKKCMLKELNVVLKTLKLSSKIMFLIGDSLVVFRRKIKDFLSRFFYLYSG